MPSNIVLPDQIRRLDYYHGQFLQENDFEDEQEYHRKMRLLHNRGLHSWGIVDGFGLSIMLQRNGKYTVNVNPGMAIDADGQEIVLPATKIFGDITYANPWITVKYKPEPLGPTDEHTNRIRESCEVEAKETKPADADKSRVIILGTFVNLQPDYTERQCVPHALNGNLGIGTTEPKDKLDVAGSAAIGKLFSDSKSKPAPQNGLVVEGKVGIGTVQPQNNLDVTGSVAIGKSFSGSKQAPNNGLLVEGDVNLGLLSDELIQNGDFQGQYEGWKWEQPWIIESISGQGYVARHKGGQGQHAGNLEHRQAFSIKAKERYHFSFKTGKVTKGRIDYVFGGQRGSAVSSDGLWEQVFAFERDLTATLMFTPTDDFDGYIDEVSLRKVGGGNLVAGGDIKGGTVSGASWSYVEIINFNAPVTTESKTLQAIPKYSRNISTPTLKNLLITLHIPFTSNEFPTTRSRILLYFDGRPICDATKHNAQGWELHEITLTGMVENVSAALHRLEVKACVDGGKLYIPLYGPGYIESMQEQPIFANLYLIGFY